MKKLIWVYLKGVAMGAADVIPGVSGGTIAFITGIYEQLIKAIKSFNFKNLKLLFTGKIKLFLKNIDAAFLLCLILGIATSFILMAHYITSLLENYPILVAAFFFGLILASTFFVGRTVKWNWKTVIAFILFTMVAFCITNPETNPIASDNSYWFVFLCGMIAICAMILPGISGSFILVLLGNYYFLLKAFDNFITGCLLMNVEMIVYNVGFLLIFIAGAIIGITSFSHVLSWLFKHFKMITMASLTGFMFGSLNKIWPWKGQPHIGEDGKIMPLTGANISPAKYEQLTEDTSRLCLAILLIVLGFVLIFAIEFISIKIKGKDKNNETVAEEEEIDSVE
jgi:putative membrane protein